jgi:hypothetical protein
MQIISYSNYYLRIKILLLILRKYMKKIKVNNICKHINVTICSTNSAIVSHYALAYSRLFQIRTIYENLTF